MGRRFQVTGEQSYNPEKHCLFLENGFCLECSCDDCNNGFIIRADENGCQYSKECSCRDKARIKKHLRDSGLENLVNRCTFDSFETKEQWQVKLKEKALDYLEEWKNYGFFISGQSGSGKTHICTAVCNELINKGITVKYLKWVSDSTKLKAVVNDNGEYDTMLEPFKSARILYIDDFFKQEITAADIRLAYDLINERYNQQLTTIISSERSLDYIENARERDGEAIAGRISEMCGKGKYLIQINGKEKNQRIR